MRRTIRYVSLGLLLLAAACDAPTSAPDLPARQPAMDELDRVARSLAVGLKDDAARTALRDALRDSPWNEHKLVFQELLASEGGAAVAAAAARAGGESVQAFRARVAGLPQLDLYVPSRDQRLSWRGTPDVAVAATLDLEESKVPGFTAEGRRIQDALSIPGGAVFLLAPAELRTKRLSPQPAGAGVTIQSRDDGEEADALYTWITAEGETTVSYSDLVAGRDPRFTPLMNHASGSATYVDKIAGYMQDGSSNYLELGLVANFYAPDGSLVASARWKKTNIPRNTLVTIGEVLFAGHSIPDLGSARIHVTLWELDNCANFCGDDNPYGSINVYYNDRDVTRSISCPSGSSVCSANALTGNLRLHWNARAASVFSSARVVAEDIFEGEYGYATARAIDQYGYPLPGYTASSWTISSTSVASITYTASEWAEYFGNAPGTTTISATINGVTASDSFTVSATYVEPPPEECGGAIRC